MDDFHHTNPFAVAGSDSSAAAATSSIGSKPLPSDSASFSVSTTAEESVELTDEAAEHVDNLQEFDDEYAEFDAQQASYDDDFNANADPTLVEEYVDDQQEPVDTAHENQLQVDESQAVSTAFGSDRSIVASEQYALDSAQASVESADFPTLETATGADDELEEYVEEDVDFDDFTSAATDVREADQLQTESADLLTAQAVDDPTAVKESVSSTATAPTDVLALDEEEEEEAAEEEMEEPVEEVLVETEQPFEQVAVPLDVDSAVADKEALELHDEQVDPSTADDGLESGDFENDSFESEAVQAPEQYYEEEVDEIEEAEEVEPAAGDELVAAEIDRPTAVMAVDETVEPEVLADVEQTSAATCTLPATAPLRLEWGNRLVDLFTQDDDDEQHPAVERISFDNEAQLFTEPISTFIQALQSKLNITNDISLFFPHLNLKFHKDSVWNQSISLSQLFYITSKLASEDESMRFDVQLQVESSSFVEQYNRLIERARQGDEQSSTVDATNATNETRLAADRADAADAVDAPAAVDQIKPGDVAAMPAFEEEEEEDRTVDADAEEELEEFEEQDAGRPDEDHSQTDTAARKRPRSSEQQADSSEDHVELSTKRPRLS